MDQHTFQNVRVSAQVHAAQAASFVEMREGTFEPFATQAQHPLATSAVNASPVPIDGGARLGFTRPVASPAIRFRDVAADSHRFEIDQLLIAVIALVADDLLQAVPVWCNKSAEVGESAKQGRCEWLLPQ